MDTSLSLTQRETCLLACPFCWGRWAAVRTEHCPLGFLLTHQVEKGSSTVKKDFHLLSCQTFMGENSPTQGEEVVPIPHLIHFSLCCWCGY